MRRDPDTAAARRADFRDAVAVVDRRRKLREPGQFLYDALPRARRYLDRFPVPDGIVMEGRA